jgi:hypothetical protein
MAPPLNRETAETLAGTLSMIRLIDEKDRKIQPRFKKMFEGLKGGIDDASEDEIALYRPQLAKLVDEIDDGLNSVQGALGLLARLRADKELMATRFEQIEKLVKTVVAIRKRFTEQASQARALDRQVDAALAAIRKSEQATEAELGALQSQVKGVHKAVLYVDAEAPRLDRAARAALEKKDQKALTEARQALIDLLPIRSDVSAMRPRIEAYRKAHPDLDRERKAEVQWMVDDLEHADDSMKRLEKIVKDLVALGQVPKEEKKAPAKYSVDEAYKIVKAIGLDIQDSDLRVKAMKILVSCPMAQWPRELAKLYHAKESELRSKMPTVRKLPFIAKQAALIDI